jgi:hypothetical protein
VPCKLPFCWEAVHAVQVHRERRLCTDVLTRLLVRPRDVCCMQIPRSSCVA